MSQPIGLSTYRWNNNLKSAVLLAAFPLLLLVLLGLIFFVYGSLNVGPRGYVDPALFEGFGLGTLTGGGRPFDLAAAAMIRYAPFVLGAALLWVAIGYFGNSAMIHAATGARPIERLEAPELYNLLENLCISRGLKTPTLYIVEGQEMNAYASGIDERSYSITVTRGLLDALDKEELEAVLGHELTHIINRDVRLLIVTVLLVGVISFAAHMLWRGLRFTYYTRDREERGGRGSTTLFMLIAAVMLAIGYVFGLILRFAVSRTREYVADAGSVELTKNPEALISALRKISANPEIPHVPPEVKQMFIENPPTAMDLFGLFATHPPIEARIQVLEQLAGTAEHKEVHFLPRSPWA
jgi:heat shock protein HtpX